MPTVQTLTCLLSAGSGSNLGKCTRLFSVSLIKHCPKAIQAFQLTNCAPSQEEARGTEADRAGGLLPAVLPMAYPTHFPTKPRPTGARVHQHTYTPTEAGRR